MGKYSGITAEPLIDVVLIVAGGYAVYKLVGSVSESIESVGGGLGSGIGNLLSGGGSALDYSGQSIFAIGSGSKNFLTSTGIGTSNFLTQSGGGIYEIGSGAGNLLTYTGGGLYQIGSGSGYAISGANPQDLLQTLLTLGKGEASTFNQGVPELNKKTSATNNSSSVGTSEETINQNSGFSMTGNAISSGTSQVKKQVVDYTVNQFGGYSPIVNGVSQPQSTTPELAGGRLIGGMSSALNYTPAPIYQSLAPKKTSSPVSSLFSNLFRRRR